MRSIQGLKKQHNFGYSEKEFVAFVANLTQFLN